MRCDATIERLNGRSLDAALACSSATLLFLLAANCQLFLITAALGVSRESHLLSSISAIFDQGYPELAVVLGLFVIILPLLRFSLLTIVLGALRLDRRPRWLGRTFRHTNMLATWAMADVFLLGSIVAYARLRIDLSVVIGPGAFCLGAATLTTLLTRATLDEAAVWNKMQSSHRARDGSPQLGCTACHLMLPIAAAGTSCPRCSKTLRVRKRGALVRASALTIAASLLYVPANLFFFATIPVNYAPVQYTILGGAVDLAQAKLYGLATLVIAASFALPIAKLATLGWCVVGVLRKSSRHLRMRTRALRVVREIGRWSMVDPFVIASFVPVTQFNALINGRAESAAPAFAAVVILTTLAAHSFDPRLMWDTAESPEKMDE